jgi:hypothetical protein
MKNESSPLEFHLEESRSHRRYQSFLEILASINLLSRLTSWALPCTCGTYVCVLKYAHYNFLNLHHRNKIGSSDTMDENNGITVERFDLLTEPWVNWLTTCLANISCIFCSMPFAACLDRLSIIAVTLNNSWEHAFHTDCKNSSSKRKLLHSYTRR